MTLTEEKWVKVYNKVLELNPGLKPSSGTACCLASLIYIRSGQIDDLVGGKPEKEWTETDKQIVFHIRESLGELYKFVQTNDLMGFASNASAAAKVAGHKGIAMAINAHEMPD